jgi:DNA-directed RNA polymerase specialized sigma24 family protein
VIARVGTSGWTNPGAPECLLCAMTTRTDPLHLLRLELERRSCSPAGRRALQRFASAGVDLGNATSLRHLVRTYHEGSTAPDPSSRALLEDLLVLAPSDEDATLCALVCLRPALYWVARRVHGRKASDDELAEVVAFAWEAICDGPPPKKGPRARHVVYLTWTKTRTADRRRNPRNAPTWSDDLGGPGCVEARDPAERSEPMLERAVLAGVLTRADAELIALTRVIGVPAKVLARDYDVSTKTLRRRRQRAEASLRRGLKTDLRSR